MVNKITINNPSVDLNERKNEIDQAIALLNTKNPATRLGKITIIYERVGLSTIQFEEIESG